MQASAVGPRASPKVILFGKSGVGKNGLLRSLLRQLHRKRPDVGTLHLEVHGKRSLRQVLWRYAMSERDIKEEVLAERQKRKEERKDDDSASWTLSTSEAVDDVELAYGIAQLAAFLARQSSPWVLSAHFKGAEDFDGAAKELIAFVCKSVERSEGRGAFICACMDEAPEDVDVALGAEEPVVSPTDAEEEEDVGCA